ncbi:hypothetical protein [Lunatibacter salilacus]|uniref:hypothetical protein n=1 Tax=Lunatibacter salilacus TaxID=2483804 RepID=UPI00131EC222|nr:hypothetical protein [Lunatibacter salilacus]
MNKILYIVATQYDNMGDLLINKCLIDALAEYGEVYLDTKAVPDHFKNILLENENVIELNTLTNVSTKGKGLFLIPFLNKFKFTHVFKSPGPFGGAITLLDKIRYLSFLYLFKILSNKGSKIFLLGNDLIIRSDFDIYFFKKLSSVVNPFYVRSFHNVRLFQNHNIEVKYVPDLCFLVNSNLNFSTFINSKKVAISFRDMNDSVLDVNIFNSVSIFISYYLSQGYSIVIFYQVQRDYDYNNMLFSKFNHSKNIIFKDSVLKWEDRSFYSDIEVVLSNRLHVLLLAQCYNTIPIGIIDSNIKTEKILNIFESINQSHFIFNLLDVEKLSEIQTNRRIYFDQIREHVAIQNNIFLKLLKNIFDK